MDTEIEKRFEKIEEMINQISLENMEIEQRIEKTKLQKHDIKEFCELITSLNPNIKLNLAFCLPTLWKWKIYTNSQEIANIEQVVG